MLVSQEWKQGRLETHVAEGGESPVDCFSRGVEGLHSLLGGEGRNICVVAHSILNKIMLAGVLGGSPGNIDQVPQGNCCISVVDYDTTARRFHGIPGGLNIVRHLAAGAATSSL